MIRLNGLRNESPTSAAAPSHRVEDAISQNIDAPSLYPKLQVTGANWRQLTLDDIAYSKIGYYNGENHSDGQNPMIRNSETRWLIGYERELGADITGSFQYHAEHRSDQSSFASGFPAGTTVPDQTRHRLTNRLTNLP